MQYNNSKDTRELLLIFSADTFSIERDRLKDNLKEVVGYYRKNTRHQYHIISQFVNDRMAESEDAVSYILNNIDAMLAYLEYNDDECEIIISSESKSELHRKDILLDLEKLYDHIALEEERIKTNGIIIRNSNQEIENSVINTFNSIIGNFQNKVDEISNSLNANIITVVGLFSAIIFVFFGGVQSLSDMINGIWEIKTKDELTIPLIIIFAIGFIIFNVVFLLLYSISKIVNKNIGSSVSGSDRRYYYTSEICEGVYGVCWNGTQFGRYYNTKKKAEKKAKRRNILSRIKSNLQQIGKRAFFRFPYVTIINIILVGGMLYLYVNLE